SRATGLPVIIDNDANTAAYGELQVGAARDRREVFFVTLGTGIGAGLIINGQIYRGAAGFAGEFGHMTIDPEGIECACGNIGCLDTIISRPNPARRPRGGPLRRPLAIVARARDPGEWEFPRERHCTRRKRRRRDGTGDDGTHWNVPRYSARSGDQSSER